MATKKLEELEEKMATNSKRVDKSARKNKNSLISQLKKNRK